MDVVERGIKDFVSSMRQLDESVRTWPVFVELEVMVRAWRVLVPVFRRLASPAMRPRHWESIYALGGIEHDGADAGNLHVRSLVALDIPRYKDQVC